MKFMIQDPSFVFDLGGRQIQVGSLAGAVHPLNDNADVPR